MLGDIGSDGGGGHRDSRRRQDWPQPSERDHNGHGGTGLDTQSHPSQQNVFGFITDWITSVSFMTGIFIIVNQKAELYGSNSSILKRGTRTEFEKERENAWDFIFPSTTCSFSMIRMHCVSRAFSNTFAMCYHTSL